MGVKTKLTAVALDTFPPLWSLPHRRRPKVEEATERDLAPNMRQKNQVELNLCTGGKGCHRAPWRPKLMRRKPAVEGGVDGSGSRA
jgi:hypothetical protein